MRQGGDAAPRHRRRRERCNTRHGRSSMRSFTNLASSVRSDKDRPVRRVSNHVHVLPCRLVVQVVTLKRRSSKEPAIKVFRCGGETVRPETMNGTWKIERPNVLIMSRKKTQGWASNNGSALKMQECS